MATGFSTRLRAPVRWLLATPTSPSAYALMLALLATLVAKGLSVVGSGSPVPLRDAFGASATDLLVYPALAWLVAAGERTRPWVAYLTYPLSALGVVLALINAAYVAIANDQIDARVIDVGMSRFDEVADIALLEAINRAGAFGAYALITLPLGYVAIRLLWRKTGATDAALGEMRVRGLALVTGVGGLLMLLSRVAGLPVTLAATLIDDNALIHTYVTWLDSTLEPPPEYQAALEDHFAAPTVSPQAMAALAEREQAPNVLFFVLESTRFDHVELPTPGHRSGSRTPQLRALAARGRSFTQVQAAMPHTSKSLVSILCGRLPAMENPVLEPTDGVLRGCLPQLFRSAGYATGFFQSAIGTFELRPRLTIQLGYEDFAAFENLDAAPLGYLSGDDRALPGALAQWLDGLPSDRPFFATLLTSGTHHPYALPEDVRIDQPESPRARYAKLVELEDAMVGETLAALAQRGLLENTVIVALADHGEGLPGDPVHQHDNNFFEEGLHVPLIVAGPGITPGIDGRLRSLLDVAPMLLDDLGVRSVLPDDELRYGVPQASAREVAPFTCWNDGMCMGFVSAEAKVVDLIADHEEIAFDRHDGTLDEQRARTPSDAERALLERVRQANARTRISLAPRLSARPIRTASGFLCGPGPSGCIHPSRPEGGFHPLR